MALLISVLEQGMIYGILALGVYITYKILDFPDLTVDGSFPFGAAVTVRLISDFQVPAILTLPIAFVGGALVGMCTGLIHVKLRVRDLLSGIIMMTGLYTINLWVAGTGYVAIFDKENIFNNNLINSIVPGFLMSFKNVIIIFVITMLAKYLLDWYMSTKSGFLLRAVGDNSTIVTSLGVDKGLVKIIGLSIANGLVALSGCIYAQQQRSFEISIGTGAVVIGLASVIIGSSLFQKMTVFRVTGSVIIGSILYKACVALAMFAGIDANAIKLITAVLFLVILVISRDRKRAGRSIGRGRKGPVAGLEREEGVK
ncbi:MAG: ABC transporter permease [Lachnospiraceae bacterium]|nr:ABC transporter permease [Lachnospiraceae bacterium]